MAGEGAFWTVVALKKARRTVRLTERNEDSIELAVSLAQAKRLYVALFRQLHAQGLAAVDDFDEDDMLITLQTYLQRRARQAGVDGTIHSEWESFLGIQDAPTCEQRFRDRQRDSGE